MGEVADRPRTYLGKGEDHDRAEGHCQRSSKVTKKLHSTDFDVAIGGEYQRGS